MSSARDVEKKMGMSLDDLIKQNTGDRGAGKNRRGSGKVANKISRNSGGRITNRNAPKKVAVVKQGIAGKRQAIKDKKARRTGSAIASKTIVKVAKRPVSLARPTGIKKLSAGSGGSALKQRLAAKVLNRARGKAPSASTRPTKAPTQLRGSKLSAQRKPKQLVAGKQPAAAAKQQKQQQPAKKKLSQEELLSMSLDERIAMNRKEQEQRKQQQTKQQQQKRKQLQAQRVAPKQVTGKKQQGGAPSRQQGPAGGPNKSRPLQRGATNRRDQQASRPQQALVGVSRGGVQKGRQGPGPQQRAPVRHNSPAQPPRGGRNVSMQRDDRRRGPSYRDYDDVDYEDDRRRPSRNQRPPTRPIGGPARGYDREYEPRAPVYVSGYAPGFPAPQPQIIYAPMPAPAVAPAADVGVREGDFQRQAAAALRLQKLEDDLRKAERRQFMYQQQLLNATSAKPARSSAAAAVDDDRDAAPPPARAAAVSQQLPQHGGMGSAHLRDVDVRGGSLREADVRGGASLREADVRGGASLREPDVRGGGSLREPAMGGGAFRDHHDVRGGGSLRDAGYREMGRSSAMDIDGGRPSRGAVGGNRSGYYLH